ncbi:DUF5320 domain-containing protein [Clostridium perfringens]
MLDFNSISIMRGQIFLASVPFKIDKEANIFYCIENECIDCSLNDCILNKKINLRKINRNINNINCVGCDNQSSKNCKGIIAKNIKIKDLKKPEEKSNPINLINRIKNRPYIILKCNSVGKNKDFVFGIPCYSIKNKVLEDNEFMKDLREGKIPNYYYLDNNTSGIEKPSYVDLSYITPIHKDNLIKYKGYIDPIDLFEIGIRLEEVFDLKSFNNCDDIILLNRQKEYLEEELNSINRKIKELSK